MYVKVSRVLSVLALLVLVYAQWQGWSPFEDRAGQSHGHGSSGRTYHK